MLLYTHNHGLLIIVMRHLFTVWGTSPRCLWYSTNHLLSLTIAGDINSFDRRCYKQHSCSCWLVVESNARSHWQAIEGVLWVSWCGWTFLYGTDSCKSRYWLTCHYINKVLCILSDCCGCRVIVSCQTALPNPSGEYYHTYLHSVTELLLIGPHSGSSAGNGSRCFAIPHQSWVWVPSELAAGINILAHILWSV